MSFNSPHCRNYECFCDWKHPCAFRIEDARIERLEAMIQCLIDNHDHGSYESEGQAFDEARVLLAGEEGT